MLAERERRHQVEVSLADVDAGQTIVSHSDMVDFEQPFKRKPDEQRCLLSSEIVASLLICLNILPILDTCVYYTCNSGGSMSGMSVRHKNSQCHAGTCIAQQARDT